MTNDLKDKVAIVTGAARGIGAAITEVLCGHGAFAIVADIDLEGARKQSGRLAAMGYDSIACAVDISREETIKAMVRLVIDTYSKIDILVNNAGIINTQTIPEMTVESWDRVIDTNLRGTHLCTREVVAEMIKNGSGKIINISSMAGQLGGLMVSPDYTAAKAGIIGLAKGYARYCAPYGINVNAVAPGFIETDMTRGRDNPKSVPLGKLGSPVDVANAVYFLASQLSDFITGATIDVNGGYYIR